MTHSSIGQVALARIACALVTPDDDLAPGCTTEMIIARLSEQDRTIISRVIRRLSEMEALKGLEAAEAALGEIVEVLARQRGANC